MTSVLNSIIKLPRYVRILATNGIDENNAGPSIVESFVFIFRFEALLW